MQKLKVLDLFSGIGGFSLGLERTGGFETVAFCEIDPFCQKVLAKHWPGVPIHDDVRTLKHDGAVDVICGGFPCQDLSVSGNQTGISGERSGLYKYMLSQISFHKPKFAIFENVTALLTGDIGRWFSIFLNDLAKCGYDAQWHSISASAVGAGHHRSRVWIIAYPNEKLWNGVGKIFNSITDQISKLRTPTSIMALLVKTRQIQFKEDEPDHRMLNGISQESYRFGTLGNSVVPKIPEIIGNAILQAEGIEIL